MTLEVVREEGGPTHPPVAEKVACVDFDGTIAPWGAMFSFPEPLPGAVEAVRRLKDAGFKVVIFTSRLSTVWHEAEGWNSHEATEKQDEYIRAYCQKYDIPADAVTAEKIPSEIYVDDKAVGFRGNWGRVTHTIGRGLASMDEAELAYFAGFFDGEGTVGVYAYPSRKNNGGGRFGQLAVSVAQVDKGPLARLQEMYGGSLRTAGAIGTRRPVSQWKLNGQSAVKFLSDILPYLRVKREQAELAVQFQSLLRGGGKGGNFAPLTEDEKAERLQIVERIKALKKVSA